jgi:hypothetical protein
MSSLHLELRTPFLKPIPQFIVVRRCMEYACLRPSPSDAARPRDVCDCPRYAPIPRLPAAAEQRRVSGIRPWRKRLAGSCPFTCSTPSSLESRYNPVAVSQRARPDSRNLPASARILGVRNIFDPRARTCVVVRAICALCSMNSAASIWRWPPAMLAQPRAGSRPGAHQRDHPLCLEHSGDMQRQPAPIPLRE